MTTSWTKAPRPKREHKQDGRRHNRGTLGNAGGRKPWTPRRIMIEDLTKPCVTRQQTEEEAWADARAMVRHMAAVGIPIEVMGSFLTPKIADEATLKKHFAWEIENGKLKAGLQVTGVIFSAAMRGDLGAAKWWAERRVPGFQPKQDVGPTEPIKIQSIPGDETL